jgi:N-acetylglucosaminyldiphosphoundecaprenol N-acetyl-beta-D-mannosaminyltransferase
VQDAVGPPECASGHEGDSEALADSSQPRTRVGDPVCVWGVPFASMSMAETLSAIGELIQVGRPSFFITANINYAMLTDENPDLRAVNERAAFIVADGAPLVWASRWQALPLPERVAGSDLIFEVSAQAAKKGHRLYFLGGGEGVAAQAAARLCERFPGLQVVGCESPPFRELTEDEQAALAARIRAARPDILFASFTQPKGERWLSATCDSLGVPVSANIGAAIDFAAGRVRRAPRWMQKCGLEWAFRLGVEPRRLVRRYARNAWFIARMVARDLRKAASRNRAPR